MRLAYVSGDYPTFTGGRSGGIGAHTFNLARAMAALGHDVSVVATSRAPARLREAGVDVRGIALKSRRQWRLGRLVPVNWLRWSFAAHAALRALHAERPLDLVVFPDAYGEGFRFALAPFAPFVVRFGGPASVIQRWDGRSVPPVRARIEERIERTAPARAVRMVCSSETFAERIAHDWALDASRFRIVRNPLDLVRFCPGEAVRDDEGPTVLFTGHLQRLKGLEELVDAIPAVVREIPGARFVIAGNDTRSAPGGGSMREALEYRLGRSGACARVDFVGSLPQAELVGLYRQCDVFVLPSHHDVFPNAVLEAMGCAKPCVVTSTTGVARMIADHDAGRVVPPRDVAAVAGALIDLLRLQPEERRELGRRARQAVEAECAPERVGRAAEDVYREAIAVGLQPRHASASPARGTVHP